MNNNVQKKPHQITDSVIPFILRLKRKAKLNYAIWKFIHKY